MLRRLLPLLASVTLGALAAPAAAQVAGAPTHGVLFPQELVTGMDGAAALEVNPAGLGFLAGWDLVIQHAETASGVGRGTGILGAWHVLGPIVVGADAQYLRPKGFADRFKGGFGVAIAPDPTVSFGLAWHGSVADGDPDLDALQSVDIGLLWRPIQWLSLGIAAHDLNTPKVHGTPVPRGYDLGIAARPGTTRVTMEAAVRLNEDTAAADPSFRLLFDPAEGFHVGLGARVTGLDGAVGFDVAASVGFDVSVLGVEAGVLSDGAADPGAFDYAGITAGLRLTDTPRLSVGRPAGVWVELTLDGSPGEAPSPGIFGGGRPTLTGMVTYLERLRTDDHVDGVVVRLRGFDGGWAQVEELRAAFGRLREAGKKVYFHLGETGTRGYWLATGSDGIWVDPPGGMWLTGLYKSVTYYEELFGKLGVTAQFVKFGDWKSFPEAFTGRGPSEAASAMQDWLLDGLWADVIDGIAAGRGKTADEVRALVDKGPFTSKEAVEAGLVDGAVYWDEVTDAIKEKLGRPIGLRRRYVPESPLWPTWSVPDRIAVIVISGSITDGTSSTVPLLGMELAGSRTIEAAIDAAVGDPTVRAIVLRIDSPGGGSVGSDHVWRKVVTARKQKPIVVSMGDVCASGGYYIAAGAAKVLADRATYTGSIGIFTGKFSVKGLFDLIGLGTHAWARGANADLLSMDAPWTDAQVELVRTKLAVYYRQFLEAVSEGRGMTVDEVDAVAQGRVWLGAQAKERRLVDAIGGVHDAILAAKEAAGLAADHPVAIEMLPKKSFIDRLVGEVIPPLPIYAEVGAPPGEAPPAADPQATEAERLLAPLVREHLGAAADLVPFASGEPLFLLPYRLEWGTDAPRGWGR